MNPTQDQILTDDQEDFQLDLDDDAPLACPMNREDGQPCESCQ